MTAHQKRLYRLDCRSRGLCPFSVRVKETDLWLLAESDLSDRAGEAVKDLRRGLEAYIKERPQFLSSLTPLPPDPLAPPLVRSMLAAGAAAGTGPMAAVAGAIAQAVGELLGELSAEVAVENGGDVYLALMRDATVGLFAGRSALSGRLGLKIAAGDMPTCLATSSGTVGHSLSLGRADAATIVAEDGALADAAATAMGNRVRGKGDLQAAVEWASQVPGVLGALAILGDKLAAWGRLEVVEV